MERHELFVAGITTLAGAMYKEGYPAEHGDLLSKVVTTPILGENKRTNVH
ncbi:hypothetical protein H8S33_18695 [Ornithinibacillus sp. BX22]|uniref:Uncharacterized protein n=2 Tax=Ornithinibacillus TaxID=484508 RepID=A0A923L981_9BACI|nr:MULTISPECIES: hypothetical protein [Ornithinibacillus]MBC5638803.1 hypothetical protein [Ornithinibacillus hominis]MBS3679798.1 hypothetical protein [Ornithinibacillus massiliensis]